METLPTRHAPPLALVELELDQIQLSPILVHLLNLCHFSGKPVKTFIYNMQFRLDRQLSHRILWNFPFGLESLLLWLHFLQRYMIRTTIVIA